MLKFNGRNFRTSALLLVVGSAFMTIQPRYEAWPLWGTSVYAAPTKRSPGKKVVKTEKGKPKTNKSKPQLPPAAKMPVQFFSTYAYSVYVIVYKGEVTNTRGVGGTLSLGPDGSYQKRLEIAGPYGNYHFDETGHYRLDGKKITFEYTNSKGEKASYNGTYNFNLKALSLTLILNQEPTGDREVFGLFIKGSENLKRHFDESGNVVFQ